MSTPLTFTRAFSPPTATPLPPVVTVLVDGAVAAVLQAERWYPPSAERPGTASFALALDDAFAANDRDLVEVVLGSRADLLWTNRKRIARRADPLLHLLHPPPTAHAPTCLPAFDLDDGRDAARLVAYCYLSTAGRLPQPDTLRKVVQRLVAGALTADQVLARLLGAAETRAMLARGHFLPCDPAATPHLLGAIDRWLDTGLRTAAPTGPTQRRSVALARRQAPADALFSDGDSGIYLNLASGLAYDDGWFGPEVTLSAEFDRGYGVLAFDVWRPGLEADDLEVECGAQGCRLQLRASEGLLSVTILCTDANHVPVGVRAKRSYDPGNGDVRTLGFLIGNPRAALDPAAPRTAAR